MNSKRNKHKIRFMFISLVRCILKISFEFSNYYLTLNLGYEVTKTSNQNAI